MSRSASIRAVPMLSLLIIVACGWSQAEDNKSKPSAANTDLQSDGLPPGAAVRLGTLRLRHEEAVMSVAFSPDGKVLASATYSGGVRLTNTANGQLVRLFPKDTGATVLFSPDGSHLICDGGESGLTLRNAATGEVIRSFGEKRRHGRRALVGGAGDRCVAIAPNGKLIAETDGKEIILWDTDTGKEVRRFTGHQAPVYCVAFSPDSKVLAAGNGTGRVSIGLPGKGDTSIILWEVDTGKERTRINEAHHGWVYSVTFSPNGKTLASSSPYDSCLWDVASQRRLAKLEAGGRSMAFSPDGKLLAAASSYGGMDRGFVHVWDAITGKPVHTLRGHVTNVNCVAFAPDSKTLASGGPEGTVRLWDAASGREIVRHDGHQAEIRSVAFSPNGTLAATVSGGDHTIRVWGTAIGAHLAKIDISCERRSHWCPSSHGGSLAFSPDGKTLACDDKVYDVASGRFIKNLPGMALAHSVDGKLLAGPAGDRYSSRGARVAVWDRATGQEKVSFSPFGKDNYSDASITAVAISPETRLVAVGVSNRSYRDREPSKESVYLYDIASGKLVHKFRPNAYGPNFLAFSPDGELLATSATWEVPVQLWRVTNGLEFRKLAGQEEQRHWAEFRPIAISPDGRLLAMAGKQNSISVWEFSTGQEVHRLSGHQGPVRALAFSPDGRTLLSGSADTMGLIWNLSPQIKKVDLSAENLEQLWQLLRGDDAPAAYRAAWTLVASRDKALSFFKERLTPLPEPNLKQVGRLLADLDADQFPIRKAAFEDLKNFGPLAEETLRKTLDAKPSLEVRMKIELLLGELHLHPIPHDELRQLRAIQVLCWIGTPAAAELLEVLARGTPALRPTRDAEAALRRLNLRTSRPPQTNSAATVQSKPSRVKEPRKLTTLPAEITSLSVAASSKILVAAAADGTVQLLDPLAGKELRKWKADERAVYAAVLSPEGKLLATGGKDRTVHLWNSGTGQQVRALEGHGDAITALAFSPDGKLLASGSLDRTVRLWNLASGESRKLEGHEGQVTSVSFSPDGKMMASGDLIAGVNKVAGKPMTIHWSDGVRLWDVAACKERSRLEGGHGVSFSPDGKLLATAELATDLLIGKNNVRISRSTENEVDGGQGTAEIKGSASIMLWDAATGQSRLRLGNRGTAMTFSPDGWFVATARGTDLHHGGKLLDTPAAVRGDGRLRLWEVATGREVLESPAEAQPTVMSFAPDGRTLVAGMKDGSVVRWDLGVETADLRVDDLGATWKAMAGEDAPAAYRIMCGLRAGGATVVDRLKERLLPPSADDPLLRRLIADLDAEKFETRQAAFQELERRGADAEPVLCLALQKSSRASRQRILALLSAPGIAQYPQPLARGRAISVLEAIGSPEARQLLELMAKGSPLARQTEEARLALDRLNRR